MRRICCALRRAHSDWRLERTLTPFDKQYARILDVLCGPASWQAVESADGATLVTQRSFEVFQVQVCEGGRSAPVGTSVEFLLTLEDGGSLRVSRLDSIGPVSLTVVFLVQVGEFNAVGGGQIQLLRTVRELVAMGVRCLITDRLDLPLEYDILHVWALDHYEHVESVCRATKPKVASTIYWNYSQLYALKAVLRQIHRRGMLAALERRGTVASYWGLRFHDSQYLYHLLHLWRARLANRRLVRCCDVVLPNCEREREWLQTDFGLPADRAIVVPNGADAMAIEATPGLFRQLYPHIGRFVLCVGRVEENKNQLLTICALKGLGIDLVFAGSYDESSAYHQMCQQVAAGNSSVHFLGPLARPVLFSAYAAASAHVLPSWSETPGLVNIEAALCGCPIVCGNIGAEQEYFGDAAFYCFPGDTASIAAAVRDCLAKGRSSEHLEVLSARVRGSFTWRRAADVTRGVYDNLASTHGGARIGLPPAKSVP